MATKSSDNILSSWGSRPLVRAPTPESFRGAGLLQRSRSLRPERPHLIARQYASRTERRETVVSEDRGGGLIGITTEDLGVGSAHPAQEPLPRLGQNRRQGVGQAGWLGGPAPPFDVPLQYREPLLQPVRPLLCARQFEPALSSKMPTPSTPTSVS